VRELGGEYGATTGRPRRCGWFDSVVVRYAARVNGLTGLAVTKMDVLDTLDELRIAVRYRAEGEELEDFPGDLGLLAAAEPVYETLPGWSEPLAGIDDVDALPDAARRYVELVERDLAIPVSLVGTGREREAVLSR
jgi:adenylosuccinate synthase